MFLLRLMVLLPALLLLGCDENGGEMNTDDAGADTRQADNSGEFDGAASGEDGAVILMYHRFGEDQYPSTNIRMEQFKDHLDYLESEDFNVWPVERIVDYLKEGREIPPRTVAITIDDAYVSIHENAFPLLKERDWPYMVFVNTDGPDGRAGGSYMSWDQLRELAENSRASFANHSASHAYLVAREDGESESDWEARIRGEIEQAESRLREELEEYVPDDPPLHAYPYGEYDTAVKSIMEDMGYVAFGQHSGPVGHHSDMLALPRFAMAEAYGDPDDFRMRVNTRPLPVTAISPEDPTAIDQQNPPMLELTFAETDIALDRINCFAGPGSAELEWIGENPRVLAVTAQQAMPEGRSRYNCTVPAQGGGFHWYSFQWIHGRK
ncbi:peptidoglycan/xylan/chitin deacetylase (PgdA/CDA1 family) [Natronospira proteinivora]|uniref:Peptidoglycan/xylan/chitin deacetylase (PgdA/CDA1 family) n=1 Tax=Natronospira proteinivora TaxID=1807133 RepID=A0ABT1G531_9GAMM|nr:polysaccharide deacetylase family protein [Natronospira proteinivora]MCP1726390.1 peptidoglycan/xylan/chitin deacetylase (PgdA/CDA1 family) [Natronospira proteinivora]